MYTAPSPPATVPGYLLSEGAHALLLEVGDVMQRLAALDLADGLVSQLPEAAKSGAVANWGAMLASRVADAALERVVTPEGVSDLLAGRLPNPFATNAPAASAAGTSAGEAAQVDQARNQAGDQAPAAHAPKPSARYLGWDRFQVSLPAKGQTVQLLLTRQGWASWQLTHIELPKLW